MQCEKRLLALGYEVIGEKFLRWYKHIKRRGKQVGEENIREGM